MLLHTSILLSLGALLAVAQASPQTSFTILVPCGPNVDNKHATVPDAFGCQRISNSGAFTVAALGTYDDNVRLGFSATPDCKQTYTPSPEDIQQLMQEQKCREFVMDPNAKQVGTDPNGVEAGLEVVAANKRDGQPGQPQPQQGVYKRAAAAKELVGGFLRKRADSTAAAAAADNAPKPLNYVMLVNV